MLLTLITAGVYVKRSVKAWMVKKSAPPPAPRDVTQQLSGITFSKMDGPRTTPFTPKAANTERRTAASCAVETCKSIFRLR